MENKSTFHLIFHSNWLVSNDENSEIIPTLVLPTFFITYFFGEISTFMQCDYGCPKLFFVCISRFQIFHKTTDFMHIDVNGGPHFTYNRNKMLPQNDIILM